MKKLFIIFLLSSLQILAQWDVVTEIPRSSFITNIYYDGTTGIACSDSVIYITTDNGDSWIQSGNIDSDVDFIGAAAIYKNRIFVGADQYGIYESSDFGKTWFNRSQGISGMGSEIIVQLAVRGDSLYAGTSGAGVFVLNLSGSGSWNHFSTGLYSNYSYSVFSLKNINDILYLGAGISGYLYVNKRNSSEWEEYKILDFNSVAVYDFAGYAGYIFMTGSLGLFTSIDSAKSFSFLHHNVGAVNGSIILMHGERIYVSYTKVARTFWFTSDDFGATLNLFEDQLNVDVFGAAVIGNRLFAGRQDGLWFRDLEPNSIRKSNLPDGFKLYQNYPNPFNPSTTILYEIPEPGKVVIRIIDVLGKEVETILNEYKSPGCYSVLYNAGNLSSGVYYYQLLTDNKVLTEKFVLIK